MNGPTSNPLDANPDCGTLYVIATPLGNLDDLSARAAAVLGEVDVVAAEDTRRSRILLNHVEVRPRVVSFHAHSKPSRLDELVAGLVEGQSVALLTDAGTPTISDPGVSLVREARSRGVRVVPVPGPSAVATALSAGGLPADRFCFLGFLPRRGAERRRLLETIRDSPWTVVVFESAQRLGTLLDDLEQWCGGHREAVVARELTKVYEDLRAGTLDDLRVYYRNRQPKGEITVLVAGGSGKVEAADPGAVASRARELLATGLSRRDAAAQIAAELNVSRNEAYRVVMST